VRVVDIDSAGASNHLQYALHVFNDIVIPEPDDTPAVGLKPSRPPAIRIVLCGMLSAIELDDQPVIGTDEIRDEGSERNLAVEFESAQSAITQPRP
jgi:hypothetical protein